MLINKNQKVPFVSVVVCTYNRKNLLKSCLNSIYAQDYPKSNFEIIIVDGGSTDGTAELCKEFPQIQFITESRSGLAYARNKGVELAQGSIVAFTDDDCLVDKGWFKNIVAGFQFSKNIMGVGGPVYPLDPENIPAKLHVKDALGLFDDGENTKLTDSIIGANFAFKKEIFKTINFDEKLGKTKQSKLILTGEDTDFCRKIVDSGYKITYTPHAIVYHKTHTNRTHMSYMLKRAIHSGITKTRILLNKKQSRIWAIRCALGQLIQSVIKIPSDTSFTSCYKLIYCTSTLFVSITGLDKIL